VQVFVMEKPGAALRFALGALAIYLAAIMPALVRHGLDSSVFIVAGDRFVDTSKLPSPIYVRQKSQGYDGQFYYRLALAPFDLRQPLDGIELDAPAWRMQRIVYPVLAWALSFGRPQLVPLALLVLNLIGIGCVAAFAVRLTQRLALPPLVPFAIVLWPGFLVTLTHDTTEILSAALILAALDCYFAGRLVTFAVVGALATLTRETGVFILGGLLVYEGFRANWRAAAACLASLGPFVIWHQLQSMLWGTSTASVAANTTTWPFFGIITAWFSMMFGDYFPVGGFKGVVLRGYALASSVGLAAFSALVASRIPAARKPLVAAWLPIAALMSVLTATGPWGEPIAFLRAFTECWVVGCLLLDTRFAESWLVKPIAAAFIVFWIGAAWLTTSAIS
jgi:hypothetical protein